MKAFWETAVEQELVTDDDRRCFYTNGFIYRLRHVRILFATQKEYVVFVRLCREIGVDNLSQMKYLNLEKAAWILVNSVERHKILLKTIGRECNSILPFWKKII